MSTNITFRHLIWLPAITFALILAFQVSPSEAQYGTLTGRVLEAETGTALPGANVVLQGTTLGAATGLDGYYRITRVPVGTFTVQVSYLGYESMTAEAKIESKVITTQDFSLKEIIITGEEVVVWGIRAKNQATALNRQMNAPNIANMVAADQMGRFPDAAAPDAVQRLPGISTYRDHGEARYIQIRGASPVMTSVQFNGERIPSPEGATRQIALDAVPVDVLEAIEVSKAITPDMDADVIGGSVNLITKKAPEEMLFNVETAGGYGTLRDKFTGGGVVTYGNRITDGKFGYLLSGTYNNRSFGADNLEPEYDLGDEGPEDDLLDELQVRHYNVLRERIGATANLDYRLNENSSLYLSGVFSRLKDHEQRRRLRHRVSKGDYQPDGSVTDGRFAFQHKNRLEYLNTLNLTAGGDHLLQSGLNIDYHLGWTRSTEDTPFDNEITFEQKKVDFFPDISDPDKIQANPESGTIDGTYKFTEIDDAVTLVTNTDYVGAFNISLPYGFGGQATGKLKLGAKFRLKNKDQDINEKLWELKDGADDIILGEDIGELFSLEDYSHEGYSFPSRVTSDDDVHDFIDKHRSVLDEDPDYTIESDANEFDATEQTIALYAMTEINLTPELMLLPGFRFERTSLETEGFDFDADEMTLSPIKDDNSYMKFFPMVHARYRLAPRTNLRAALTTAMSRPNFLEMVSRRVREDEDIEMGNPALKPTYSTNLDLMFEHYDRYVGVISAGAFYKQIKDPIYVFTWRNALGGETSQPKNGESAWIMGVEVALQKQLKFLPSPFDGLGVYGNYTLANSETTLPGDPARKASFSGQADHVFNAALSYEKYGFSGQLSLNYHGNFLDEYGGYTGGQIIVRESDVFVNDHIQLDLTASYQVLPSLSVFLEVVNLMNETVELYQGIKDRRRETDYYGRWGRFGIRYNL